MDGHELAAGLRVAHGCRPDCPHCRREAERLAPPRLERFETLIGSELALRFAHNKVELGLEIPRLSDDALEQYLIEEAILLRWRDEAEAVVREQKAWKDARETGQRAIEDFRKEQGLA